MDADSLLESPRNSNLKYIAGQGSKHACQTVKETKTRQLVHIIDGEDIGTYDFSDLAPTPVYASLNASLTYSKPHLQDESRPPFLDLQCKPEGNEFASSTPSHIPGSWHTISSYCSETPQIQVVEHVELPLLDTRRPRPVPLQPPFESGGSQMPIGTGRPKSKPRSQHDEDDDTFAFLPKGTSLRDHAERIYRKATKPIQLGSSAIESEARTSITYHNNLSISQRRAIIQQVCRRFTRNL
ncbi:hypothetical protein QCA50_014954 [Cerrena zonata]|uniref:Uncharacterized protein n=1 Tax=Cerrena zonata TaxID=2478898 RepID=A0AAW0FKN3_9APHY